MTTADKLIQLTTDLGTINDEVTDQGDLISLVREAVEWLPDKQGEGEEVSEETSEYTNLTTELEEVVNTLLEKNNKVSYDTCTVNLNSVTALKQIVYLTVDESEEISIVCTNLNSNHVSLNCLCNSFVVVSGLPSGSEVLDKATHLCVLDGPERRLYSITAKKGETATITVYSPAGGGSN